MWIATEPIDMRAGTETALALAVKVFGAAYPHHADHFSNRRANRMKVLVHDGIWLHTSAEPWPISLARREPGHADCGDA